MPDCLPLQRFARVAVVAELLLALGHPLRERRDAERRGLRVPDERLLGDGARLLVGVVAVHHRERGRGLVAELADGLLAVGLAAPVVLDPLLELLGRVADGERQQPEPARSDLVVTVDARRRAPDRRVRILERLRVHAPLAASTSACPRTRTRRSSSSRRCGRALRPTSRASRAGRCRSLRSRRASTSGRCRTRRGRPRRGRASRRSRRCAPDGCTASAAGARRSRGGGSW